MPAILYAMQIDTLVFIASPVTFDPYIVQSSSLSVHADADIPVYPHSGKGFGGKLTALVRVQDLGIPIQTGCPQEGFAHKAEIQRIGDRVTEQVSAVPVYKSYFKKKALLHGDVGDIGGPNLVGTTDIQRLQKIRIDLVVLVPLAQPGLLVDGFQAHDPVKALHPLRVHPIASLPQAGMHARDPIEGIFEVDFIHQAHEFKVPGVFTEGLVIEMAFTQAQQR